jgi:3-dehydroquinate synthase
VLIDPDCLNTLSDRAFSDGMAEVIKYGCIRNCCNTGKRDRYLYDFLC